MNRRIGRYELTARTTQLRDDLRALVLEFEEETGATVSNIDVEHVSAASKSGEDDGPILGAVTVEIERIEVRV